MEHSRIYLVGFMGAGKTSVGRRLAEELNWRFIDLDEEIERREGRRIREIFAENGEPYFRSLEQHCLHEIASAEHAVIALGGGAFMLPEIRELTGKTGLTIWLKVSLSNVRNRVKIDGTRPKFQERDQVERLYDDRQVHYALASLHVCTDSDTPETVVSRIMREIQTP